MVTDPVYKDFLKAAFPGHDPAFYDALVYAGTIGSPVFDHLSKDEKFEILEIFRKYEVYF